MSEAAVWAWWRQNGPGGGTCAAGRGRSDSSASDASDGLEAEVRHAASSWCGGHHVAITYCVRYCLRAPWPLHSIVLAPVAACPVACACRRPVSTTRRTRQPPVVTATAAAVARPSGSPGHSREACGGGFCMTYHIL